MLLLALIAATFVSEDLASLSAGLLVRERVLGFVPAAGACALGIFLGDVGLWAAGRLANTVLGRWRLMARFFGRLPIDDMRRWLQEHVAVAMLGSRFVPGCRLPMYVCAGIIGMPLRQFATWAGIAVLIWAPLLVWFAAETGAVVLSAIPVAGNAGLAARALLVVGLFVLVRAASRRLVHSRELTTRLGRWSRWEFWPMWLFYAPVALWVLMLAVRHRGISTITAANPGIPDGGLVGESKFQILSRLPAEWTIPSAIVEPSPSAMRRDRVVEIVQREGWTFPIVLKPDVGQRGTGVRLARAVEDVDTYCAGESGPILAQPYHPGPFEAGIFYYRFPGDPHGKIFSITDKEFPVLVGDGRSTIEELIWAHPRYRFQTETFLRRHHRVRAHLLERGERFQLAIAGNHAQGTLFRDGWHLWTPALERRIDEIAQAYPGFFIGRFDVRYADVTAFRAGEGLAIVELNGAAAESTNIYDPTRSLANAYGQLFRQWSLVFAIGAANRRAGAQVTDLRRLVRLLHTFATSTPAFALSD